MASYDPRMQNATRPGHPHEHWRDVFDAPSYSKLFDPPIEEFTTMTMETTIEKLQALMMTVSFVAVLPDFQKEVIKEEIRDVIVQG